MSGWDGARSLDSKTHCFSSGSTLSGSSTEWDVLWDYIIWEKFSEEAESANVDAIKTSGDAVLGVKQLQSSVPSTTFTTAASEKCYLSASLILLPQTAVLSFKCWLLSI